MRLRSDWYDRAAFGIIGAALSVYVLVGLATCSHAQEPERHDMSITPLETTQSPYVVRIDGYVFYCVQRQCQPVDFYVEQESAPRQNNTSEGRWGPAVDGWQTLN